MPGRHVVGVQERFLLVPPTEERIAVRDDEDARFEFGLDCLLDGIAARLNLPQLPDP